jgi:hypothetical protein
MDQRLVPDPQTRLAIPEPEPPRQLGFSSFDNAAVTAFAKGDATAVAQLIESTRLLAEALAGPEGDTVRVRMLARIVATARTQQRLLEALLGERLAQRDFEAVDAIEKVLNGVASRLSVMTRHLRAESETRRRPVVLINNAERVSIGGRK